MNLNQRPNDKAAQRMQIALVKTSDSYTDRQAAMEIWRNFRWKLKILPERTYENIEALIDTTIKECQDRMKTPLLRDAAIQRLTEMRNRLSEFIVKPEPEEGQEQAPE